MTGVKPIEPDKGWAWVILLAAFLGNSFVGGIIYSFGVFYLEFLDYFETTKGTAAWIGSVICAVYAIVAPIASLLCNKVGCRVVTICGGLTVSIGFILCTFSTSVWMMIVAYGVMGGLGFGMVYLSGYIMIGYYFEKKRSLALGIAACGSSIGGFVFAPMSSYFISKYTWQGALLIIAGIVLNDIVIGSTYRTLPSEKESLDGKDKKKPKKKLLDFSILKLPACSILCVATFVYQLGFYIPFIYLPDFAREVNISKEKGAFLLSIIGISNTVGRILAGIISNTSYGDPLTLNNVSLLLGGAVTFVVPWLTGYPQLCVFALIFGFCYGNVISLATIILVEFLGRERLGDSFGFLTAACGTSTLIGPPLAGALYDSSGSYTIAFMSAGGAVFLAGLLCLPLRIVHNYVVNKDTTSEKFSPGSPEVIMKPLKRVEMVEPNIKIYGSTSSFTVP